MLQKADIFFMGSLSNNLTHLSHECLCTYFIKIVSSLCAVVSFCKNKDNWTSWCPAEARRPHNVLRRMKSQNAHTMEA